MKKNRPLAFYNAGEQFRVQAIEHENHSHRFCLAQAATAALSGASWSGCRDLPSQRCVSPSTASNSLGESAPKPPDRGWSLGFEGLFSRSVEGWKTRLLERPLGFPQVDLLWGVRGALSKGSHLRPMEVPVSKKRKRIAREVIQRLTLRLPVSQQESIMAFFDHRRAAKGKWTRKNWELLISQAQRMGSPAFERRLDLQVLCGEYGYPSSKKIPTAWQTEKP